MKKLDRGPKVTKFSIHWQLAVLEKRYSFCYKCSQLKAFGNGQTKQQSINGQICLQQTNFLAMVLPLFLASTL